MPFGAFGALGATQSYACGSSHSYSFTHLAHLTAWLLYELLGKQVLGSQLSRQKALGKETGDHALPPRSHLPPGLHCKGS